MDNYYLDIIQFAQDLQGCSTQSTVHFFCNLSTPVVGQEIQFGSSGGLAIVDVR